MRIRRELTRGQFLQRLNRFAATVRVGGAVRVVRVPNSGRLQELLVPGRAVQVALAHGERPRKTDGDLLMVAAQPGAQPAGWVCIDSHLTNALVAEALEGGGLPGLEGYRLLRSEVAVGKSRIDHVLIPSAGNGPLMLLEVKSVTLVEQGVARFPDAPTERGRRHLQELAEAGRRDWGAAVAFVVQREDARIFAPNERTDPAFATALRDAAAAGVRVLAYDCRVGPGEVTLRGPLPIDL